MADPQPVTRIVSDSEARQERERQAARESAARDPNEKPMTETRPGGEYYLEDGKTKVDANGKELKD